MEGSEKGASLLVGALVGQLFVGIRKDWERRAQRTDTTPHCHGGPFTGNSGNGASLSMGALLGERGGGLLYPGSRKVMKGRLWGWTFMGGQLGNLEWAPPLGTLRCG